MTTVAFVFIPLITLSCLTDAQYNETSINFTLSTTQNSTIQMGELLF